MKSSDQSKEFGALMRRLRTDYASARVPLDSPSVLDPSQPLLALFVRSFLLWDSTRTKADAAMRRLEQALVDFNDLRVCLPDELVAILGERYPRAGERALAIRSALSALFALEHALSLEHLARYSPEAQRDYLASLTGTPPFVAARVRLLGLGAHAAPVDTRLLTRLIESKLADKGADAAAAATTLERLVLPGEMPETIAFLQAFSDDADIAIVSAEPPRVALRPPAPHAPNGESHSGARAPRKPGPASPRRKTTKSEK